MLLKSHASGFRQRAFLHLEPHLRRAILLLSTVSSAVANANVVGSDTQNFNPTTSGLDFVTVHSSETLEPGFVNFGLFLNQAVNTLPYFEAQGAERQTRTKYSDAILAADLNFGIGLLPNWDVGLSLPQMLHQTVRNEDGTRGQFAANGNTEVRINTKVRLWGTRDYGVALVGSSNINRIKNNPFTGKGVGPTYNLEVAADTTIEKLALGINAGRRWRKPGTQTDPTSPIEPLGDQWIYSAAASYLFSGLDTKLIFELFGSQPVTSESENSNRLAATAEALVGVKHDFTTQLAGHAGAGSELINGRGSPDWRVYFGMNYAIGPTLGKISAPQASMPRAASPQKNPFAGPPQAKEKIVIHDVLFEFDSDTLVLQGSNDTLERLAAYLNTPPAYSRLVIEGHTDSVGSDSYNLGLSQRRAATIRNWMISRYHLKPHTIQALGKGERAPIADNGNYQGRQLNRRVEFTIYRDSLKAGPESATAPKPAKPQATRPKSSPGKKSR